MEIHESIPPFEAFKSAKQDHAAENERVDTQAADEYSRPEDTSNFLDKRPERLRVARPAAATAGFFRFHILRPWPGCTGIDEPHRKNVSDDAKNCRSKFPLPPPLSSLIPLMGRHGKFSSQSLPRFYRNLLFVWQARSVCPALVFCGLRGVPNRLVAGHIFRVRLSHHPSASFILFRTHTNVRHTHSRSQ